MPDSNRRSPVPQTGALTNYANPTISGAPKGTRTPDLLLRRQLLYPAELLAHISLCRPRQSSLFCGLERVMGIEPTRPAWKAGILPLNYTRRCNGHYYSQTGANCQGILKNFFLFNALCSSAYIFYTIFYTKMQGQIGQKIFCFAT